jgi:hypothetical protein
MGLLSTSTIYLDESGGGNASGIWWNDDDEPHSVAIYCYQNYATIQFDNKENMPYINVEDKIEVYELEFGGSSDGGSKVVANPTLEGNEVELTGIFIDGQKYKLPQSDVTKDYVDTLVGDINTLLDAINGEVI